nr:MAG: hypothetical protein DIU78_06590 [Pseudomonadota bacterium]
MERPSNVRATPFFRVISKAAALSAPRSRTICSPLCTLRSRCVRVSVGPSEGETLGPEQPSGAPRGTQFPK